MDQLRNLVINEVGGEEAFAAEANRAVTVSKKRRSVAPAAPLPNDDTMRAFAKKLKKGATEPRKLTVAILKEGLKAMGEKTSGNKNELFERAWEAALGRDLFVKKKKTEVEEAWDEEAGEGAGD